MRFTDYTKSQLLAATSLLVSIVEVLDILAKIGQLALLIVSIAYTIHKWRKSSRKS